ncbi:MAG: NAD(P)/FAD-dependent oxidoreductase [Gemmatimonadetes bacterium]|nr:NAD(P)/FAD-dependent oxidoreductase [Gemmatimonadota bacterium]
MTVAPHEMTAVADVLIVGAGPAGSALACLLAERGWDVRVLERARFPRPKPCGECVNPGGVEALSRLGLLEAVLSAAPARIAAWEIDAGGSAARGAYPVPGSRGLALPREVLDAALAAEAIRRGARIDEGVRATGFQLDPGCGAMRASTVRAGGGADGCAARILVGADGLRSVVARQAGLLGRPPRLRKLSLTCHLCGSGPHADTGMLFLSQLGAFGLAPVQADGSLWNGTLVVDSQRWGRAVAGDALGFYYSALARLPIAWDGGLPEIAGGPWASGPFDRPTRRAVADRVVLVGDAAGYYDPLTGQGIYRALRSAELAAPVIDRALRADRLSLRDIGAYDRALRRAFGPGRAVQRAIEFVIAHPAARAHAVRRLAAAPLATDALVRVTGDLAPVRTLLHPRVWLPVILGVRDGVGQRSERARAGGRPARRFTKCDTEQVEHAGPAADADDPEDRLPISPC